MFWGKLFMVTVLLQVTKRQQQYRTNITKQKNRVKQDILPVMTRESKESNEYLGIAYSGKFN